jgi:hypothetical protein
MIQTKPLVPSYFAGVESCCSLHFDILRKEMRFEIPRGAAEDSSGLEICKEANNPRWGSEMTLSMATG